MAEKGLVVTHEITKLVYIGGSILHITKISVEEKVNYVYLGGKGENYHCRVLHWYEEDGVESLRDRRGSTKPKEEMFELERLKYEN